MNTRTGATRRLPGPSDAPTARCASGDSVAGRDRPYRTPRDLAAPAFFPSAVRAQVTALACTLPRDSGKPLSRWSATELARAVIQRGITRRISGATIKRWLRADRIKPWQYHRWQRSTDPRFLERAIPILTLYERAQALARKGHLIVCADEKTSIQARQACGRTTPAQPGRPLHLPDRYQRQGAVQLFGGLLVHTGETLARCFERKRFVEFQLFLRMLFGSLWCRKLRVLHLILDNGPTHAPKRLPPWVASLDLPFPVHLHWLPVHASWLDQIEIVFSELQRKALTPNDFASTAHVRQRILGFFAERNRRARPIQWTYTAQKHLAKARVQRRLATAG
jgi:DDE superfamily endonuclease